MYAFISVGCASARHHKVRLPFLNKRKGGVSFLAEIINSANGAVFVNMAFW